jgi:hypothetical protein
MSNQIIINYCSKIYEYSYDNIFYKFIDYFTGNNTYASELCCINNKLYRLNKLPYCLKILYCYRNNLIELPELPQTLIELYCYYNNLTKLPELPTELK